MGRAGGLVAGAKGVSSSSLRIAIGRRRVAVRGLSANISEKTGFLRVGGMIKLMEKVVAAAQ
jgi:hypothetical protein